MSTKIIFLDIDGVICLRTSHYQYFDKECCARIKLILEKTGAKIVVSSTWRKSHTLQSLKELMTRGYELESEEHVEFDKVGTFDSEVVIGMTPTLNVEYTESGIPYGRGAEISAWLSDHPEVNQYVVIDDDRVDIVPHTDPLVQTDTQIGITDSDVQKAVSILGL
jgi:hypothetical protein